MEEAINVLERKRNEWIERAEYHRKASMEAHVAENMSKRDEERQLAQLAIDNINGLGYAIEVLKNN